MLERVQLFITCILDTLYPEVGEAVVRVLQRAGAAVEFPPDQTCCGQPAFNAGMRDEARRMAIHTIQVFEKTTGAVVVPSGSCAAMIRHGYLELFAHDEQWLRRSRELAGRTYEFTEYLVDVQGVVDLGAQLHEKVTYHSSCHLLRELGVDLQPRTLLSHVRGVDFIELTGTQECCGFGGVFSVEHPQISNAMLERKLAYVEESGASLVVSCDAGCITNINGGLRRRGKSQRAVHIAEILDQTSRDDSFPDSEVR